MIYILLLFSESLVDKISKLLKANLVNLKGKLFFHKDQEKSLFS